MKKLRFAALGAAKILDRYMGDALRSSGATELSAIASRDPERADRLGKKFGCRSFTDYRAVLEDPGIDAVYIPLPIGLHEPWTLAALERGKHVLCEKSLSHSLESCERMIAEAERRGLLLAENFMCEYHPQHAVAMDTVRSGRLGSPRFFEAHFGIPALPADDIRYRADLGGGALNDVGAYLIFMSRKLFGGRPEILGSRLWFSDRGVDERGSIHCVLPGGISASLQFGFGLDYRNDYRIWGEKGRLEVDRAYAIPPDFPPPIAVVVNGQSTPLPCAPANHFHGLLADFARAAGDRAKHPAWLAGLREQARLLDIVRTAR